MPTGFENVDTHVTPKDLATANALVFTLKERRALSESSAIQGADLCLALRIDGPKLRGIINYLRSQGDPECSKIGSSTKGYWWAETREALGPTEAHLEERSRYIERARRGLVRAYGDSPDQVRMRL